MSTRVFFRRISTRVGLCNPGFTNFKSLFSTIFLRKSTKLMKLAARVK